MPNPEPLPDRRSTRRFSALPRFQFSLFWLMVAVTVVAVVLGLGASIGSFFGVLWFVLFMLIRCVVPTPLVICAIFGRGHVRAFAIGALMPWVLDFRWEAPQSSLFALLMMLVYSAACGFVAVATWRWGARHERKLKLPILPQIATAARGKNFVKSPLVTQPPIRKI